MKRSYIRKPVKIVETGKVYPTAKAAAEAVGGTSNGVSDVLRMKRKTHKGYHFQWHITD